MKKFIDNDTHDYILKVLEENGLNKQLLDSANKMDIDFVHIFNDKIIGVKNKRELEINKDVIVKMLLGVYGNFIASLYYKAVGYKIENEYPVLDDEKNEITRADISFKDHNGKLNLCEVKTTPQIIDNIRNYQDDEEELYNGKYYYDMDNDIIKYKEIGKKLINQVKKLKTVSDDVSVVVFKGCFMDDIIKDKLKELGVEVKVLGVSIHNLKKLVEEIVEDISNEFIRDLKPKLFKYELKNAS